jgi:osomolarity two-component system, phosphorelay intermediate protein YPD1
MLLLAQIHLRRSNMATRQARSSEKQQPGEWTPATTEDFLDATTFDQLLEMDDDDEREFSKGIVWNYFEQVKGSFVPIEEGMYSHPLPAFAYLY